MKRELVGVAAVATAVVVVGAVARSDAATFSSASGRMIPLLRVGS
jgi:hypothetical protein